MQLRDGESTTALLLFLYSFLAKTSYNIVTPITRSEFITSLGVDNLPWVQFGAGVLIGLLMQGDTILMKPVPRRWTIPVTPAGMAGLLLLFWFLFATIGADWVAVAFYVLALILGIRLISQFWTLANDVCDPRQAKRIFGLIGGGFFIVTFIMKREQAAGTSDATKTGEDEGVSSGEAIAAFLAQVTVYLSLIGFVIQVGLTSRIHRVLGIGFALLVLPMSLGTTAVIMLFNRALGRRAWRACSTPRCAIPWTRRHAKFCSCPCPRN